MQVLRPGGPLSTGEWVYLLMDSSWPTMGLRGHRTGLAGHACPAPQHGTKADGAMKGV